MARTCHVSVIVSLAIVGIYVAYTFHNVNHKQLVDFVLIRGFFDINVHRILNHTNSNGTYVLLIWTTFFGEEWHKNTFSVQCGKKKHVVTDDKSRLAEADVILFHCRDPIGNQWDLVHGRQAQQMFVLLCAESPSHTNFDVYDVVGMNATMTYRLDSDFPLPYGKIVLKKNTTGDQYKPQNIWEEKRKSVAWLVSNCYSSSKRDVYVRELANHIDVDVYGYCGMSCLPEGSCTEKLVKEYKFYLAFENSVCCDYITEKFFGILHTDIVPVVLGGANYTRQAPPHSFISVMDYHSPRALAEHLKQISKNKTEYYSYFLWKDTHELAHGGNHYLCDLVQGSMDGFQRPARRWKEWWNANTCDNDYITRTRIHW